MSLEVLPHTDLNAAAISEYARSIDELRDPILRRDYFEHLSEDDFLDFVGRAAAVIRTGDQTQMQPLDGDKVALMMHEVPDQADKEQLLRETWRTAQELLKRREYSDEDALEYAALTVAGGILYAHPFIDGNGRTSRVLSFLISQGSPTVDQAERLVSESSPKEWQIAPSGQLVNYRVRYASSHQPRKIEWEDHFVGEGEDALDGIVVNSVYGERILRTFIEDIGDTNLAIIHKFAQFDEHGTITSLDGNAALDALVLNDTEGLGNAIRLRDIQKGVRADYVRAFLSSMLSSDRGGPRTRHIQQSRQMGELLNGRPGTESARMIHRRLVREIGRKGIDLESLTRIEEASLEHRVYSNYFDSH